MNETKPVEINPSDAGAKAGVESQNASSVTSPKAPEVDTDLFEAVLQTSIETRDTALRNAENWKKVGLAKKKGDDTPPTLTEDDIEMRANIRAQEIIAQNAIETARIAEDKVLKTLRENRELRIAAKNKTGITTTASTVSTESSNQPTTKTHGWSDAQVAELKKKGIDPLKAWANYSKLKS